MRSRNIRQLLAPPRFMSRGRRPRAASVKANIRPIDFYRAELPTMPTPRQSSGWVPGGLCPFHNDHRPNNFRVNLDSGRFRCFACGNAGRDIIDFTMRHHGLSFGEAVQCLAEQWGIFS